MLTSSLLLFGRLADRYGVKRTIGAGFVVFTVSSFFCGVSRSLDMLIAFRAFQGLGAAMLGATMYGVITWFSTGGALFHIMYSPRPLASLTA